MDLDALHDAERRRPAIHQAEPGDPEQRQLVVEAVGRHPAGEHVGRGDEAVRIGR